MSNLILWGQKELARIRRDSDRLFDALCTDFGLPCISRRQRLKFEDTGETLIMTATIPDAELDDIELLVSERIISLTVKRDITFRGGHTSHSYRERIGLPCPVHSESSEASFKGDVLTVTMPKKNPSCRISITAPDA